MKMNHPNRSKAGRIEAALIREGLRAAVGAIDANPSTPGEVVLWIGGVGVPVYSVREALDVVETAWIEEVRRLADEGERIARLIYAP